MPIELIVRPFQSRKIDPPKSPSVSSAQSGTSGPVPVRLEWGKTWQLKILNGSLSIDETLYSVKKMRERPRT